MIFTCEKNTRPLSVVDILRCCEAREDRVLNEFCRYEKLQYHFETILINPSGCSICVHAYVCVCAPSRKLSHIRCTYQFLHEHQNTSMLHAPPLLSSSIIIQPCLPIAVKTALDNSLRQCQPNCNILPATIMRTGLQTHRNKHMAPCSRLGCCIHDFATVVPIFLLLEAILLSQYGQPLPAGNPTCQPMQYCPLCSNIIPTVTVSFPKQRIILLWFLPAGFIRQLIHAGGDSSVAKSRCRIIFDSDLI